MSDREEEAQDYDYTKEIQQFKRIWKSYNNQQKPDILQETVKQPNHDPKSKTKTNVTIKNDDKKQRPKSSKQTVQPSKKEPELGSKHKQTNNFKDSPKNLVTSDQIHIQTKVNQNKLKNIQLGLGQSYNQPYMETKYRNSGRTFDSMGSDQLKREIDQKNQQIALLRVSSNRYHDKISNLEREIQKRDNIIANLRNQQRKQNKQANKGRQKEWLIDFGQAEYESLKKDVKRLLQMLKNTDEYKQFASLGLDDGSVRFLHEANKKHKTNLDVQTNNLHFCTCNKAFISEPGLWVPENIYKFAKEFVKARKGELTNAQLQLLIYDFNKMWRERQKTIINSLNGIKAQEIGVYRRKIQNLTNNKGEA